MTKNMNESNSTVPGDEQINNLFQEELACEPASESRIASILESARRETGVRDLVTHLLLRIWIPILSLGSQVFVFYQDKSTQRSNSAKNKS